MFETKWQMAGRIGRMTRSGVPITAETNNLRNMVSGTKKIGISLQNNKMTVDWATKETPEEWFENLNLKKLQQHWASEG